MQVDRLQRWRVWDGDAETAIELCGEEVDGESAAAMLDEAMQVYTTADVSTNSKKRVVLYTTLIACCID